MIETIIGVLAGLATIALARRIRGEHWVYALSLISLPTIYAGFAWYAGESRIGWQEMLFGLPFLIGGVVLTLARRQIRWAAAIVGALWLAHGGYDLLHPQLFINPGVPAWYPAFCAGVDIVVGLYLLGLAASPARRDLRTA